MIVNKYQGNGGGGSYVLPAATQSTLGGVKIGSGITVQPDGTISAEGGSVEDAYKIELSTSIPDDFTQEDIANLNAFFAAVEADPSIADGAYVMAESTDIYRCSYSEYDSENHYGNFMFDLNMANDTRQIELGFEDGEYVNGGFISWNSSTIIPTYDFPADPSEGQIANYDDGQGNIGLYRYDGTDWVPFGGGDNTVLKASSGTPENIVAGDVYAKPVGMEEVTYPSARVNRILFSNSRLYNSTNNGVITDMTVTDDSGEWAIRYYRVKGDSGDEMLQYIVGGKVKNEYNLANATTNSNIFPDATRPYLGAKLNGPNGSGYLNSLYIYIPVTFGEGNVSFTEGPNWDGTGPTYSKGHSNVSPTYEVPTYDVFQAGGISEKKYATITGEGSYRNAIDTENIFWLDAGTNNKMVITFNDMTAGNSLVFHQEVNGELYEYIARDENGVPFNIQVYNPSSTLLFTIPEGESTQELGGEPTYYSFSGNVLTISREWGGNFANWTNNTIGVVLGEEKLVKADDVEGKLLPDADPNYGLVLQYNSEPEWVHPSNLTALQLINIQTEGEQNDYPTFLARTNDQDFAWKKLSFLEANTTDGIPSGAKDGAAWVYGQKGQSGGWKSYDGGSYKKMRINNTSTFDLFFDYGTEHVSIQFVSTGMTVNGNLWLPVDGKFTGTTAGGLGITGQTSDGYFYCDTDSEVTNISKMPVFYTLEVEGEEIPASYGIKQYQGLSETENEWIHKDSIPEDRDYSINNFRVDVSDPNTYAQINFDIEGCTNNITWADGAWKSSDIELTDDGNGVYTGSSSCGWSVSAWTSGSYFYVSSDYSIEDGINIYEGGEWYVEVPKPVTANVVTSTDIKRMIKISQADYTALAVKDPETMYIIIG